MSPEAARAFAHYNRAMNERIYACCAKLTDEVRKRDTGAFFKSIHGTLNHSLLGDRLWMGRFTSNPFQVSSLDQELYADFLELRAERAKTDVEIETWARGLTADELDADFAFSSMKGEQYRMPMWFVVSHYFNHQTHHRGQVTALLSQQGLDPGVTDLIRFPSAPA